MAESIARHTASDVLEVSSAGLYPLGYLPDITRQTLLRNGYPPAGLSSKPLRQAELEAADLVINLTGEPRHSVFKDSFKVEDWPVPDPYGEEPAVYQRILEELEQRIGQLADRLRAKRQTMPSKRAD
jgi:protein-tyrosine-phosphatase